MHLADMSRIGISPFIRTLNMFCW